MELCRMHLNEIHEPAFASTASWYAGRLSIVQLVDRAPLTDTDFYLVLSREQSNWQLIHIYT